VPLIRYDVYEKNNGAEGIKELTATVSHYFTENIQGFVEFWDRTGDGTTIDDNRLTLQLMAAFSIIVCILNPPPKAAIYPPPSNLTSAFGHGVVLVI
jgi:hypothetical protein